MIAYEETKIHSVLDSSAYSSFWDQWGPGIPLPDKVRLAATTHMDE